MLASFIQFVKDNPIFAGITGSMLAGSILYVFKTLPLSVLKFLIRLVTVEVRIENSESSYYVVSTWLSNHKHNKISHRVRVSRKGKGNDKTGFNFELDTGNHIIWHKGPLWVYCSEFKLQNDRGVRREIVLRILGFRQDKLRKLLAEAEAVYTKNAHKELFYIDQNGTWNKSGTEYEERSLDSIFMESSVKDSIVGHVDWFLKNQDFYKKNGIPYKTGILLHGIPGSGKTSLAKALGNHFNKKVYYMNLGSLSDDYYLIQALSDVSDNSIVLLEDIDCVKKINTESREIKKEGESNEGISLSGLLNGIDGIFSGSGKIFIMTTNHIEKLDTALIRPGRIDKRVEIGAMQPEQVVKMANAFFSSNQELVQYYKQKAYSTPLRAPCDWQLEFIEKRQESMLMDALQKNESNDAARVVDDNTNYTYRKTTIRTKWL